MEVVLAVALVLKIVVLTHHEYAPHVGVESMKVLHILICLHLVVDGHNHIITRVVLYVHIVIYELITTMLRALRAEDMDIIKKRIARCRRGIVKYAPRYHFGDTGGIRG